VTACSCGAAPMAQREASCAALLSPAEPGGHRGGSPGSVRGSPEALSGDPLTDPADVWSRGSPDRQISADWRSGRKGSNRAITGNRRSGSTIFRTYPAQKYGNYSTPSLSTVNIRESQGTSASCVHPTIWPTRRTTHRLHDSASRAGQARPPGLGRWGLAQPPQSPPPPPPPLLPPRRARRLRWRALMTISVTAATRCGSCPRPRMSHTRPPLRGSCAAQPVQVRALMPT
jgi:hypothetical protein